MTSLNETTIAALAGRLPTPSYDRSTIKTGIVHFGVGGFHRSHEAMFIDRLLNVGGSEDWGICGVGVLPSDARMRDVLKAQDGLYTLVLKSPDGGEDAAIIGSIAEYLFGPDDPTAVIRKLVDPGTRIVSLSVTEGGYSINDSTGEFEPRAADVVHDLESSADPRSVFGFIAEALARRREQGSPPFTIMSCDNIQGNGNVARRALVSFARLKDAALADWIRDNVAFPNSMVDRITPVTTEADRAALAESYGYTDEWPVVAEPFEQWVLEDNFPAGRPPLERVGVQIVDDVEPYEAMKLRLLNASHQVMSYLGYLAGHRYVHEVCTDPVFADFIRGFMEHEATPTLRPVHGIDLDAYRSELIRRFSNPAIRDTLARQMVDASERIPKFLLPIVREQLKLGGPIDRAALVIAAWVRCLEGTDEQGERIDITDQRQDELRAAVRADQESPGAFLQLPAVFGDLGQDDRFVAAYRQSREALQRSSSITAVQELTNASIPPRRISLNQQPIASKATETRSTMADFNGRTILVTGASGGIGGATVKQLIAAGATVIAGARQLDSLTALCDETGAQPLAFDLTSEESIKDAVEGLDLWGVVNCGGFGGEIATPQDTDIDVFDKVISINARGALLVTKYAVRSMIRHGNGGAIVNVSSQASLVALTGHVSYGSSKAALDNITRVSALELGKHNIRVNSVNPTVVMTEMSNFYWGRPEIGGPFLEQMPLGRWATVDDVAAPILFLLSDAASMITGVSLPIDGGYTSR